MTRKGLLFSDKHLMQTGSTGHRYTIPLISHIEQTAPDFIVMDGDIIEGKDLSGNRETVLRKLSRAYAHVCLIVEAAIAANPDVEIVYIFGNHDSSPEIREMLDSLVVTYPRNFNWEEGLIKRQNTLFFHGDLQMECGYDEGAGALPSVWNVPDAFEKGIVFERPFLPERPGSAWKPIGNGLDGWERYKEEIMLLLKNLFDTVTSPRIFPIDVVAETIWQTLKEYDDRLPAGTPGVLDGVTRICMGHVHAPYATSYVHPESGIEFLISGPASLLSQNTMYTFDIDPSGCLCNFEPFALQIGNNVTQMATLAMDQLAKRVQRYQLGDRT